MWQPANGRPSGDDRAGAPWGALWAATETWTRGLWGRKSWRSMFTLPWLSIPTNKAHIRIYLQSLAKILCEVGFLTAFVVTKAGRKERETTKLTFSKKLIKNHVPARWHQALARLLLSTGKPPLRPRGWGGLGADIYEKSGTTRWNWQSPWPRHSSPRNVPLNLVRRNQKASISMFVHNNKSSFIFLQETQTGNSPNVQHENCFFKCDLGQWTWTQPHATK